MTTLRAAAQQALEALEEFLSDELRPYEAAKTAAALKAALAEPQEPVAWLRVIDEAMVTHHLGVADPADDYETAKRKMNELLCCAQDIGAYFAAPPEQPAPEPVAYIHRQGNHWEVSEHHLTDDEKARGWTEELLYTTPPQRQPLSLTDLQEALVLTNLVDRDAIDDSEEYDEGSTLAQIDELHRIIERAHGIGGQDD